MSWRRSSRSGPNGNCVELRGDLAAVRDSKRPGVVLPMSVGAVRELVSFLRTRP